MFYYSFKEKTVYAVFIWRSAGCFDYINTGCDSHGIGCTCEIRDSPYDIAGGLQLLFRGRYSAKFISTGVCKISGICLSVDCIWIDFADGTDTGNYHISWETT